MPQRYCEVALPVPLRSTFTYEVPSCFDGQAITGCRLLVPFRERSMVGVALEESPGPRADATAPVRPISELLDARPALAPNLIELGRWISRYYLAPIGETFRAMLPPEVELRHEREYRLSDRGRAQLAQFALDRNEAVGEVDDVSLLRQLRSQEPISSARLSRLAGGRARVEKLVGRGWITAREVARERQARTHTIVALGAGLAGAAEAARSAVAQKLPPSAWATGAKKGSSRRALADQALGQQVERVLASTGPLPVSTLVEKARVSRAAVERLRKNGLLISWQEPVTPGEDLWERDFVPPANVLNEEQSRALAEMWRWIVADRFAAGLLHGVTGSGKTEVYLGAIEAALSRGKSAIVLVPEIALTLWMGRLVRARFGATVATLHSGLPEAERAREWWRVREGEARVVVGTRSAVFAPLENVGLIVVDEEQESAYKQEETPRYNGRDVAVYRARLEGAVALLGSATPSLETYHNAREGKYGLIELARRVANRPLATVRIIDLRQEFRERQKAVPVSEPLRAAIASRLEQKTQAMILINRRGYSWLLLCRSCGAVVECQNCSIALTYHKGRQRLVCHYCNFAVRPPKQCPKCHAEFLYFVGDGAERVEEYLRDEFPEARIARLDRDAVRTKRAYQQVLGAFAENAIDILVGTQMVAKGHDFPRVTLVGVVAADLALGRPDFRAAERTFQLLTQVAGRAGRGELCGEVLVETYYPEHYAITYARQQDYASFYEKEAHFRKMLHYPPFAALAGVLIRDRKVENAIRWARALGGYFAPFEQRGVRALGPAAAPLARLRGDYRFQFVLKSPERAALGQALAGALDFCAARKIPETAVVVDVDPMNLS